MGKEKVFIAYGEAAGIIDVWGCGKAKARLEASRGIMVVKRRPTEKVLEEAKKEGIEIVVTDGKPKEEAKRLASRMEKEEGKEVRMGKIEEIADRSMMYDVC